MPKCSINSYVETCPHGKAWQRLECVTHNSAWIESNRHPKCDCDMPVWESKKQPTNSCHEYGFAEWWGFAWKRRQERDKLTAVLS